MIQISVSYDAIKKNKTLGDFSVKAKKPETVESAELPVIE